jgi:long-chain acyl-CoA synthetase
MKATTFCQRFIEAADERPDKVAMKLLGPGGAETTTYGSMLAQVRSLAYRLRQEGISFGDRVAIISENDPKWAMAYLGILYYGAVVVPLDPAASDETLTTFINDSGTKLVFASSLSLERLHLVCERLGRQIPAVVLNHAPESDGFGRYAEWAQTLTTPEFNASPPNPRAEDIALLIYTSGTTGVPKAVALTHGNIYAESDGLQDVLHIDDEEVILGLLPLFHIYSQMVNLWLATIAGACVIYITDLSGKEIERGLKEGRVTALTGVPRLWYLFHKNIFDQVRAQPALVQSLFRGLLITNGYLRDWFGINMGHVFFKRINQGFGGRLRRAVSGGASFDVDVARDFHRLGFTILQGYGLTETCGAATVTKFDDNKIGSVGTPLNNVAVKIDKPNGEGIGEVLIRGSTVMPGYYRNEEANRDAFTADGWFRSGDIGRFDLQGHLYIVGRTKDVVVLPSGKNIYPEDVEAHYARSPLISEISVLGVSDEAGKFAQAEKLCAVVVPDFEYLKANHIANAREAIRFELDNLGRELPEYQRAREYIVRAEPLPRTATRKVRRFELHSQIEALRNVAGQTPDLRQFTFTAADRKLMDSPAGRALASAMRRHGPDDGIIHPKMNLELDLGLDSLARAECIISVEQALGVNFESTVVAAALAVGELINLVHDGKAVKGRIGRSVPLDLGATDQAPAKGPYTPWREILANSSTNSREMNTILERKRLITIIAYLVLRSVYLAARLLFRIEVSGLNIVTQLHPPFLICPNHQSYLDPILVCSVYPHNTLRHIFHIGASEYFATFFTSQLARLINIVRIDPDLNLLRAMRAGATGLRAGKVLNIYPEGQRSFDGLLHEFKKGASILATEINVPIVPVALDGVYRVWPRKSWRIGLAKVKIKFGEPISPATQLPEGVAGEAAYEMLTGVLKERIQLMLDEMRQA